MASEVRESLDAYLAFQIAEVQRSMPLISAADQEAVHSAASPCGGCGPGFPALASSCPRPAGGAPRNQVACDVPG